MSEDTQYRVRLSRADRSAIEELAYQHLDDYAYIKMKESDFDVGWGSPESLTPYKREVGRGRRAELENSREFWGQQVNGLVGRVVPAKTLVSFPLREVLGRAGPLPPEIASLERSHDLFLGRLVVRVVPHDGERITYLRVRLEYAKRSGAITWSMWPTTKLSVVASAGMHLKVGLNAELGFELPQVPTGGGASVGGGARADADANFMLVRRWRRVSADIVAIGSQDGFAEWRLRRPSELRGDVEFLLVGAVPQKSQDFGVRMTGSYSVKPHWFKKAVEVGMSRQYRNALRLRKSRSQKRG